MLFQFNRDMEDELAWIQDKLPTASSKDWGTSLQSTQAMLKKHQVSHIAISQLAMLALSVLIHLQVIALMYKKYNPSLFFYVNLWD